MRKSSLISEGLFGSRSTKDARAEYEPYQQKEAAQLKGIDFDRLAELIEISRQRTELAKQRELILLIGRTGAGKSTTLNYLMGSRLAKIKKGVKQFLEIDKGQVEYAAIGHADKSKTLHPQVVPMLELDDLAYCDCPGFSDNRTREEGLCSSVGLPMAIMGAKAIRAMMIVIDCGDLTATRGEGFAALAKTVGELLKNPAMLGLKGEQEISKNLFYVFTKVSESFDLTDILTTINEKQEFLAKEMKELIAGKHKKVMIQLTQLLGVSEIYAKAASDEEREKIIKQAIDEMSIHSDLKNRIQELSDRSENINDELSMLAIQSSLCQSILNNSENAFIIRGDEKDDKQKLLSSIKDLHVRKQPTIPKDTFSINGNNEWQLLDSIMQNIAIEGEQLLDKKINYPVEHTSVKKYKRLAKTQQASQKKMLENLQSSKLELDDLNEISKEFFTESENLGKYLDKTMQEKQAEQGRLEHVLQDLDTDEPIRYRHRNLEPVNFKMNAAFGKSVMRAGIGVSVIPNLTLGTLVAVTAGFISITSMMAYKLRAVFDLPLSNETAGKILFGPITAPIMLEYYLIMRPTLISCNFKYHDKPFVKVNLESNPSFDFSNDKSFFFAALEKVSPQWMQQLGFDSQNVISKPASGIYEITYNNMHGAKDYTGDLTVWVELFVEKRIHPEIEPQINRIKKELEYLESMMSGYLKHDQEELQKGLAEESKRLKEAITKEKLQTTLINILEKRLSQHESRMQVLHGCLLGYETSIRETTRALFRQKQWYRMVKQLVGVIGANEFVKNFIHRAEVYFQQPMERSINTVWGRKKTPNEQPDYVVQKDKVAGTAIGAFFKPSDKLYSAGWLGKLGYNSLDQSEFSELSSFSRVRRGSALACILEKIAADLYAYLSDGEYIVPKTRLAELPIENQFTKDHDLTQELFNKINDQRKIKINEGIYVMSKFIENYQDLSELKNCVIDEQSLGFEECLNLGRVPEYVVIEGKKVPLKGLMEILAISRLLADTDVLGGGAKNAGFLIERGSNGEPSAVRVVKVDPGYAFNFDGVENLFYKSQHPQTLDTNPLKKEPRHLQYGNQAKPLLWHNLTEVQRNHFTVALQYGLGILKKKNEVFTIFMDRHEFNETPKNKLKLPTLVKHWEFLQNNLNQQEKVYATELETLRENNAFSM